MVFGLFIFREKGREGEREGEKHQCVVASHVSPTGNLACNPGMYPDWESNQQPLGSQAGAQSTELHQPGLVFSFFMAFYSISLPPCCFFVSTLFSLCPLLQTLLTDMAMSFEVDWWNGEWEVGGRFN